VASARRLAAGDVADNLRVKSPSSATMNRIPPFDNCLFTQRAGKPGWAHARNAL
jgi:hypothetical protein